MKVHWRSQWTDRYGWLHNHVLLAGSLRQPAPMIVSVVCCLCVCLLVLGQDSTARCHRGLQAGRQGDSRQAQARENHTGSIDGVQTL